jgi:hypothetical protein
MLLNYLMLGMTDFSTSNAKTTYGIGVMTLTGVTTLTNVYVYLVPKILSCILSCKKRRLNKVRNKKRKSLVDAIKKVRPKG